MRDAQVALTHRTLEPLDLVQEGEGLLVGQNPVSVRNGVLDLGAQRQKVIRCSGDRGGSKVMDHGGSTLEGGQMNKPTNGVEAACHDAKALGVAV